eukprot:424021-Amphidinium_carterae.1
MCLTWVGGVYGWGAHPKSLREEGEVLDGIFFALSNDGNSNVHARCILTLYQRNASAFGPSFEDFGTPKCPNFQNLREEKIKNARGARQLQELPAQVVISLPFGRRGNTLE